MPSPPKTHLKKDWQYHRTAFKDMWRYRLRRIAHKLQQTKETLAKVQQWKAYEGPQQTLSVCIITMNAADRIAPLLEYLKAQLNPCDEIVVGVDSKTTDNTAEVCSQWANNVFTIENPHQTCNAGLEELVNQCQGNWVLRLDDDEFPEPEFFSWLQGVINTQNYTHYKLPRLHLSKAAYFNDTLPVELEWINDSYLYPDYQMRLFKNEKALLSFPGAVGHSSIECKGPRGKIHGVNLVHLNMAMNPRFKREQKLNTYIKRLNGGWVHPVNELALLFEDFNYAIEPYQYPDNDFCRLLAKTAQQQRETFEANKI